MFVVDVDVPRPRQAFWIIATEELYQAVADFAAGIAEFAGVDAADECALGVAKNHLVRQPPSRS